MGGWSNWLIPGIFLVIVVYAAMGGIDVFETFLQGAKEGLQTVANMFPSLLILMAAASIFKASGALELLVSALQADGFAGGDAERCSTLGVAASLVGERSVGSIPGYPKKRWTRQLCWQNCQRLNGFDGNYILHHSPLLWSCQNLKNKAYDSECRRCGYNWISHQRAGGAIVFALRI